MKQKLASLKMSSPGRLGIFVVLLAAFPMALGFLTAQEAPQAAKKILKNPPEQKPENPKNKKSKRERQEFSSTDRSRLLKATAESRESRGELLAAAYGQASEKKLDKTTRKQIGNELLLVWDLNGDGRVDRFEIANMRNHSIKQPKPAVSKVSKKEKEKREKSAVGPTQISDQKK